MDHIFIWGQVGKCVCVEVIIREDDTRNRAAIKISLLQ